MRAKRSQLLTLALILLVLGCLAALARSRFDSEVMAEASQGPNFAAESETLRTAVEHLEAELEIERAARAELTREIEALRDEVLDGSSQGFELRGVSLAR